MLDGDGAFAPEQDRLPQRAIALQIELKLVLTGVDAQPLQRAIELVGPAHEVAVDEHLGLLGRDLEPGGTGPVVHATPVVGIGIGPGILPGSVASPAPKNGS